MEEWGKGVIEKIKIAYTEVCYSLIKRMYLPETKNLLSERL